MEIKKVWFDELPQNLEDDLGDVVVVDANAATTNTSILLSKGPQRLIVVNEKILPLAQRYYPDSILVGESQSIPPENFYFSNRIPDMWHGQVKRKSVLWMSHNGSRVFERMVGATSGDVLAGAFCNATSLAQHLQGRSRLVTIIMSGNLGYQAAEDRLAAEVIACKIRGQSFDWEKIQKKVADDLRWYCQWKLGHILPGLDDDIGLLLSSLDRFPIIPRALLNSEGFIQITDLNQSKLCT